MLNCCLKINICGLSENTSRQQEQQWCVTSLLTVYVRKKHFEETQDRKWRWAPLFQRMLTYWSEDLLPMAQCMLISAHITAICQPLLVYPPLWTPSKLTADWRQTNCNHGNQLFGKSSVGGCGGGGWIGLWVSRPDTRRRYVQREIKHTMFELSPVTFVAMVTSFPTRNPCRQIICSSSASAPVFVDVWSPFCQKAVQVGAKVRGQRPGLRLTVLTCAQKPPRAACNWFLREMDLDPSLEQVHHDRRKAEWEPAGVQGENTKRCQYFLFYHQ